MLPNPPPTSGAMTRSLSSGIPVTTEQRKRTMCGFWVVFQRVSSPVARLYWATAPRGSIAFGISRCWRMRSLMTTPFASASAKAASRSPPPATVQWNAWLPGMSSPLVSLAWSCGASAAAAFSGSVTVGSGS